MNNKNFNNVKIISAYCWEDKIHGERIPDWVGGKLYPALEALGIPAANLMRDETHFEIGNNMHDDFTECLKKADIIFIFIGKEFIVKVGIKSQYTSYEYELVIAEQRRGKKLIIPFQIDNGAMLAEFTGRLAINCELSTENIITKTIYHIRNTFLADPIPWSKKYASTSSPYTNSGKQKKEIEEKKLVPKFRKHTHNIITRIAYYLKNNVFTNQSYTNTDNLEEEKKPDLEPPPVSEFRKEESIIAKKIFISYSKEDLQYCNELLSSLMALERVGIMEIFYDLAIEPGKNWDTEVNQKIENADIVLCLLSGSFLNNDYIWNVEMEKAKEKIGKNNIVPIFISPCILNNNFLEKINGLPNIKHLPKGAKAPDNDNGIIWIAMEQHKPTRDFYYTIIAKKLIDIISKQH